MDKFFKRELYDEIKPLVNEPQAIVVTGMRRSGKTSLLRYVYKRISSENKLFWDLENPLNRKFFEETNYETIKKYFESQGIDFQKKTYIFLDEIQVVQNIPSVVKYFIDHYQVKFFLTGSASFYLKNLFSESLAGRKYLFELYPLSFREFLVFKGQSVELPDIDEELPSIMFESIIFI